MGAIVYESGGILIDHGWLRILGSGHHSRLGRSLPDWNAQRANGFFLVADDVVGGFFALNGGALGNDPGQLYYLAPDTLEWMPCRISYSQFLLWAVGPKLDLFYETLRWPDWKEEVHKLSGDHVISFYPLLSTKGLSLAERSRRPVPIEEHYSLFYGQR